MIVHNLSDDCGPVGSAPKKSLVLAFTLGVFCIWHAMMLRSELSRLENHARELVYQQAMAYVTANVPPDVASWYTYFPTETALLNELDQDDSELIDYARKRILVPPNDQDVVEYYLDRPNVTDPSDGLALTVIGLLGNMTKGFFVEAGALDGEVMSSTLMMERFHGWTGLLIEPDPLNFKDLYERNRRAWLAPVCLSFLKSPILVSYQQKMSLGKIQGAPGAHRPGFVDVQCFPLFTLLLALNKTTIDYLSLDIEGSELDVLRTVPFGKLDITIVSVEYTKILEGKEVLKEFMKDKGYRTLEGTEKYDWGKENFVFVREK